MKTASAFRVDPLGISDRTFGRICQVMYDSVGMALNASKKPLVKR